MATLYIREYQGIGVTHNASGIGLSTLPTQGASEPGLLDQTVAIGGSSAVSAKFSASTRLVRIHPDSICSIQFSTGSAVATAVNARMIAGQTEYFRVIPGMTVAVISNV